MPSPLPPPGPQLLKRFRGSERQRAGIHPLERAAMTVVAVHLCFLPWALGTMHAWAQITSLAISGVGFVLALCPRNYTAEEGGGQAFRLNPWPRLLRFPLFWIGAALLAYIAVQGFNPSWVWERNASMWWLRRVDEIDWLPTSVDSPFDRFNLWRQFIIYASVWLAACTIWVGITRRRSVEYLLLVLAGNGTLLMLAGFIVRLLRKPYYILWFPEAYDGAARFATFIYKNHAGAYFALMAVTCVALAVIRHEKSAQKMDRSSPTLLYVLGALAQLAAVGFTYSRGATLLLTLYLVAAIAGYFLHRRFIGSSPVHNPAVSASVGVVITVLVGFSVAQINFDNVERRFELLLAGGTKDASVRFREQAHVASKEMFGAHWQRGVGAGGFRFLYPEYIKKHPEIYKGGKLYWEHAHDDWLEIPIELGIAGCALLLLMGSWIVLALVRLKVWHDLAALLICGGLLQTLAHATFDFPLQNPAVLVTWFALAIVAIRRLELEPS